MCQSVCCRWRAFIRLWPGKLLPRWSAAHFSSVHVEIMQCTPLHLDNLNTHTIAHPPTYTHTHIHTHTQDNMSWHTNCLLWNKWAYACLNTHMQPSQASPTNVYATAAIKASCCFYVGRQWGVRQTTFSLWGPQLPAVVLFLIYFLFLQCAGV